MYSRVPWWKYYIQIHLHVLKYVKHFIYAGMAQLRPALDCIDYYRNKVHTTESCGIHNLHICDAPVACNITLTKTDMHAHT